MKAKYTESHDRLTFNVSDVAKRALRVTVSRSGIRITNTPDVPAGVSRKIMSLLTAKGGGGYGVKLTNLEASAKAAADFTAFEAAI